MVGVSKLIAFVAFAALFSTTTLVDARRARQLASPASEFQNITSESQPPSPEGTKTLSIDLDQVTAASGRNEGFVTVNGKYFYLNGSPWHCAGTNAYYAAITDRLSAADVDSLFRVSALSFLINFFPFCFHPHFSSYYQLITHPSPFI